MKLWVDVEDIFDYALHVRRPSGIQRVAFELQRALVEIAPDSVQFIRHGHQSGSFVMVPFARLEALFDDLAATHPSFEEEPAEEVGDGPENGAPADGQMAGADGALAADANGGGEEPSKVTPFVPQLTSLPPRSLYRRLRSRALKALPEALREPVTRLWVRTAEAVRAAIALVKIFFTLNTWRRPEPALPTAPAKPAAQDVAVPGGPEGEAENLLEPDAAAVAERERTLPAERGDWLVVLGSPWSSPQYAARVASFCAQHGLRFALLVYDIIPIRRPEWVDYALRLAFQEWFHEIVPLADTVLAISQATAADVERYERETSFGLRGPVTPIPLGTGFGRRGAPMRTRRLPARRSFALIVSTIEARKNHLLLFRIWRELTEIMPMDKIPKLVFAGRVGWLVQDLMQQLKNTDWLNGKIVLIDSPSDAELATLYDDCLFTLYPSFYEGWGLPVSESLAYGAPCISSNRTSLPEAGGDLALYFDPDNLADAVRTVRGVIEDPEGLQSWRARVVREFKPRSWTDSARAIIDQLQKAGGAEVPPRRTATIEAAQ